MDYIPVALKIVDLLQEDLDLRDRLLKTGQLSAGYHEEMRELHDRNAHILNQIIDNIGYPTIDKVGKEASDAAWIIIQHAIGQPAFMKKCLSLLAEAVKVEKADPKSLAYLGDRIAVLEGRPQLYGTQFDWDENGQLSPNFVDEPAKVNERRKMLGLVSLEEQTAIIRERAKKEKQSPPSDLQQRNEEMEAWRKNVGWI